MNCSNVRIFTTSIMMPCQGAPIRLTPDINMGGTPLLAVSWVLDGTRQLQFHEFGLSSCLWPPYHS